MVITTSTDKIEQQWYELMAGDLMLDEDHALRGIIQSLTDYANTQLVDMDGDLIEVQMTPDGEDMTEMTEDEWARRLAEGLSLILYGGTVRHDSCNPA